MFDVWADDNRLIYKEYQKNNYLIREYDNSSEYVVIYFSSNGIYFPNEEEVFQSEIVEKNRFEWKIFRREDVCKEIYVRDLYKQWYVSGISESINDIPKLLDWLSKQIPEGKKLITVGSSAGGYMSLLAGVTLGAELVYSFSGMADIYEELNEWGKRVGSGNGSKEFFDIYDRLNSNRHTVICYMYAAYNQDDIKQYEIIKNIPNLFSIGFKTSVHAECCYKFNYKALLQLDEKQIMKIINRTPKLVSRLWFSILLEGFFKTFANIGMKILRIK